jgi:hypothetical protein
VPELPSWSFKAFAHLESFPLHAIPGAPHIQKLVTNYPIVVAIAVPFPTTKEGDPFSMNYSRILAESLETHAELAGITWANNTITRNAGSYIWFGMGKKCTSLNERRLELAFARDPSPCEPLTIDYRCEDGRFPGSLSCVTISNPNLLSRSEKTVYPGMRS